MIRHVPELEWKRKESYSLLSDTLYHLYQRDILHKRSGLVDALKGFKSMLKAIPKRVTRRASNVPGISEYADDFLLKQDVIPDKKLAKRLDDLIEGTVGSYNRGETELLTLQNLVRERDILSRPGREKLIRAVKEIGHENPLATALLVGSTGALTTHGIMNNREW